MRHASDQTRTDSREPYRPEMSDCGLRPAHEVVAVDEYGQPAAHRLKRAIAEFVWHFAGPQTRETTEATAREKLRDVRLRNAGHVISMIARADRIKEPRIRHRALRFVDVALGGSMGIPEQFELFQKER